jgi:hypothetical protein
MRQPAQAGLHKQPFLKSTQAGLHNSYSGVASFYSGVGAGLSRLFRISSIKNKSVSSART